MKYIKWKTLIITSIVCLLPIFLGLALWDKLPEMVAVHFDINNNPDNFAPKWFAVFGLPFIMVLLQGFCCITNDINAHKHGENKKVEMTMKWIIPVLSVVLQTATVLYALGHKMDMRRIAMLVVSLLFLVTGRYLPQLDYIKNYKVSDGKARKINRFIGVLTVIMGILGLITIIFPPIISVIWFLLLIPYTIIGIVYGIKVARK